MPFGHLSGSACPTARMRCAGDLTTRSVTWRLCGNCSARDTHRPLAVKRGPHVAAGDVPHRDEQHTAILAGLVHGNDVRIVKRGGGA